MGKFAIECPKCGVVNTAATGLFAKTKIRCGGCGSEINTKTSRIVTKICPHCEKIFAYDQANVKDRVCPSCGQKIDASRIATAQSTGKFTDIRCPQCECSIEVDATKERGDCPLCGMQIDIRHALHKKQLEEERNKAGFAQGAARQIIQYNGDSNTLIWKHPNERLRFGDLLIVDQAQKALVFVDGVANGPFLAGQHELQTENLSSAKHTYPDGFPTKVYFFNSELTFGCNWGTDKRVRFQDPETQLDFSIGACGEFKVKIGQDKEAPRRLLLNLVGTGDGLKLWQDDANGSLSIRQESLMDFVMSALQTTVKSNLASVIVEKGFSILDMDRHLSELSDVICQKLSVELEPYGLEIPKFYVTRLALPEDEPNFVRLRELNARGSLGRRTRSIEAEEEEFRRKQAMEDYQLEANRIALQGQAQGAAMAAQGYSQKDLIDADIKKAYAASLGQMGANIGSGGNGGGGGMASDMLGMMMASKLASTAFGTMDQLNFGDPTNAAPAEETTSGGSASAEKEWTCTCGSVNVGAFCSNCGSKKPETWLCSCGASNIGKFCQNCGSAKPESWTCSCGAVNTGKFCSNCGSKKESVETWDCTCGCKGIRGKFCTECGNPRP